MPWCAGAAWTLVDGPPRRDYDSPADCLGVQQSTSAGSGQQAQHHTFHRRLWAYGPPIKGESLMTRTTLPVRPLTVVLFALAAAASAPTAARDGDKPRKPPPAPVSCAELATDPANGLLGNPDIKSVTSDV